MTRLSRFSLSLSVCAATLVLAAGASAEHLYPIKDINPAILPTNGYPGYFTDLGTGVALFVAREGDHGEELWRTDGTDVGTFLLKDINPGPNSSSPSRFVRMGDALYFSAADGINGTELWRTDGTLDGTALVRDVYIGPQSSYPGRLTVVGGTLFFVAWDAAGGGELWKSDGTFEGTVQVNDIEPGTVSSSPDNLANAGGILYFSAQTSANGRELWKSDGTAAGTVLVADIRPGTTSTTFGAMTGLANGTVFFSADDGPHGLEPWRSDGTPQGTLLLADLWPGSSSSATYTQFFAMGNTVIFDAKEGTSGRELWRSDGTPSGTVLVKDIVPGSADSNPSGFTRFGGQVFFATYSGLWKTDGSAQGTTRISGYIGFDLTVVNQTLYFTASNQGNNDALFRTDGTPAGTVLVKDIRAGTDYSNMRELGAFGDRVLLSEDDGVHGQEPWISDGTDAGTVLLKDVNRNASSSNPAALAAVGSTVFFAADDGVSGSELWKSDGTEAGTVLVKDVNPGSTASSPRKITNVNGRAFFVADNGLVLKADLWVSNGTPAGTTQVTYFAAATAASAPDNLTPVGGTLFFTVDGGVTGSGVELWKTTGSGATSLVKDIRPFYGSNPHSLAAMNGTLYFGANDGTNGDRLWKSDGTAAGTVLVVPAGPGWPGSPTSLTVSGGSLFFAAGDPTNGVELWRSDGTAAGTVMVKNVNPTGSSAPDHLIDIGGTLYFTANDGASGVELWKSDGTAGGTVLVDDIAAGPASSSPSALQNVAGTLFFTASDGDSGVELWKSDGTPAGTSLVEDIAPGATSSAPASFATLGGNVFFRADNGADGAELWSSDGSVAGTFMVKDLNPGAGSSNPSSAAAVSAGPRLLFAANDGTSGVELWGLQNVAPVADAGPDIAVSGGSTATLDASASLDPDGDILSYRWTDETGSVISTAMSVPLPPTPGAHTYSLTVFDGFGGSATDSVVVTDETTLDQTLNVDLMRVDQGTGGVAIDPPSPACVTDPASPSTHCESIFRVGTLVTLTAFPNPDSVFLGWNGACIGTLPVCTVTITDATFVSAAFRGPQALNVDLMRVDQGTGGVAIDPPSPACVTDPASPSTHCESLFRVGTLVTLTAFPNPDSVFLGWNGACIGTLPVCTVTVTDATFVSAAFRGPQTLNVDLMRVDQGTGGVAIDPPSPACVTDPASPSTHCESLFRVGTLVTLTAFPNPDSVFLGWNGACIGTLPVCTVTVTDATFVSAAFRGPQTLNVDLMRVDQGTGGVAIDPPSPACVTDPASPSTHCESIFRVGTLVTLTAFPNPDSVFLGWNGACIGTSPVCTVTITDATFVSAAFRGPQTLNVDVSGTGSSSGTVTSSPGGLACTNPKGSAAHCDAAYPPDTTVTLTAVPDSDSVFVGWGGGCAGSGPCQITISATISVSATFRLANRPPTASAAGPYAGVRSQAIAFDGSASTDPDGDALTYLWTFGDGASASGPQPSHAYSTVGAFTATLVVSDGTLTSAPSSALVTISNRPPTVNAGADQTVELGATTILAGAASDPDADALTYEWRDSNGTLVGTTPGVSLPLPLGTHALTLTVTDALGASAADAVVVTVRDTTAPGVALLTPAGEQIYTGVPYTISWTASDNGAVGSFNLAFSADGGATFAAIPECSGLAGSVRNCVWNAPAPATSMGRIRLIATDASNNASTAMAAYSAVAPAVSVTSPNSPVNWGVGSTEAITWTSNLAPTATVSLEVSRDSGSTWSTLATSLPNAGSYPWVVAGPATTTARIRVRWSTNPSTLDVSDSNFAIAAPFVTVTAPNTSVRWSPGSTKTITWTGNLGPQATVNLELSRNSGSTWSTIATNVANAGAYNWIVAGPNTNKARVRVTWSANTSVRDASDVDFSIR